MAWTKGSKSWCHLPASVCMDCSNDQRCLLDEHFKRAIIGSHSLYKCAQSTGVANQHKYKYQTRIVIFFWVMGSNDWALSALDRKWRALSPKCVETSNVCIDHVMTCMGLPYLSNHAGPLQCYALLDAVLCSRFLYRPTLKNKFPAEGGQNLD